MPHPTGVKGLARAIQSLEQIADPMLRLSALRQAIESLEKLESDAVAEARAGGVTWATVGALYGLTKQGAQQRFRTAKLAHSVQNHD